MGKKKLKKVKKEEKKEIKKEEKKLRIREHSGDAFVRNMKAMKDQNWPEEFMNALKEIIEKPIAIEDNIVFHGVKNPLVSVFIGFSTRKLLDALKLQKKITRYTCIIEPDMGVFKHLIITEDISDLINNQHIDFVVGTSDETLIPVLFRNFTKPLDKSGISRTTLIQNIEMLLDPFVHTTPETIEGGKQIVEIVKQTVQQIRLSMGCPDDQFRRLELMMINKQTMYNAWNMKGLFDKFKDVPVFVLGGGPSLNDFIEEYKANDKLKNGLIIAVDAVLRKLLDNGIRPHLVVRCERKLTSIFEGISKEDTKGIYYCAYPWTPPEFFELFDNHFYLFRQNGVCLFTKISHAFVDGGVSSGNAALEIAINLGCKNIIFSGLDMCMIGDKTHVDGTEVEFNIQRSKDKWSKVKTNKGTDATTIPVWDRCRKEYFQAIQKHRSKGKEFEVINTSEEGAVIPLTTHKLMKDISPLFDVEHDIHALIDEYKERLKVEEIENFEKIISLNSEKFKKHLRVLEIAEGLMEDAKRTADREIEKLVGTCKSQSKDPYEFILILRNQKANLDKLWSNVTDAIDTNFKRKLYVDEDFRTLVFDVLQLQLFHYENNVSGLVNTLEHVDHRHYAYYITTKDFMQQVKYYLEQFVKLFA